MMQHRIIRFVVVMMVAAGIACSAPIGGGTTPTVTITITPNSEGRQTLEAVALTATQLQEEVDSFNLTATVVVAAGDSALPTFTQIASQIPTVEPGEPTYTPTINEDETQETATAEAAQPCSDTWFFDNPPNECPGESAIISDGAAQVFEQGLMIWSKGTGRIIVLHSDNQSSPRWERFTDQWSAGMAQDDQTITAPSGLFQPVRGFGLVWREKSPVRDRLGWATGGEFGFPTAFQCDSAPTSTTCYLLTPDGVVVLESGGAEWHIWAGN